MFSENGVASAMPFLRLDYSAKTGGVFPQDHRKCLSAVPDILLTCPAREHTTPLPCGQNRINPANFMLSTCRCKSVPRNSNVKCPIQQSAAL